MTTSAKERFPSSEMTSYSNPPDDRAGKCSLEGNSKAMSPKKYNPFLGLFYVFLTSLLFQIISVIVKKLYYISPCQLSLIRSVGIIVGSLPLAIYSFQPIFGEKKDRCLQLVRSFLAATGFYMNMTSFRYLPLAEAAIIHSTAPIVTTTLARIWLKEACDFMLIISLALTVLGVLSTVRLPELLRDRSDVMVDFYYLGGLAAALAAVLCRAGALVALRKVKQVHYSISSMYTGFVGLIENAIINATAVPLVTSFCGWDQILCLVVGAAGFIGNCSYVLSVHNLPAGIVCVEKASFDIMVTIVFQILLFFEYPDGYVICGACLVMVSLIIIGIQNYLIMTPTDSKARKYFSCFVSKERSTS